VLRNPFASSSSRLRVIADPPRCESIQSAKGCYRQVSLHANLYGVPKLERATLDAAVEPRVLTGQMRNWLRWFSGSRAVICGNRLGLVH